MTDRIPQIGFILQRLSIISQRQSLRIDRVLKPYGLSFAKLNVLVTLSRSDGSDWNITRLTQVLQLNQPKVSKIVQSLYHMGWITLTGSQGDARQKAIKMTHKGRQLSADALKALSPIMLQMYEGYEVDELKQLASQLEKLYQQSA